jgi:hypothetical protein
MLRYYGKCQAKEMHELMQDEMLRDELDILKGSVNFLGLPTPETQEIFDAYETRKASSPEKTPHCRTLAIECGATQEFEDFYSFYSRYTHPTAYSLFGDHTSSVRDIFLDRAVIYAGYCAEEMSKILEVAIELNQKSPGLNSGEWFQTAAFLLSPCAIILPTESSTRPGCKAFRQASESLTDFDRFAPSCLGVRNLQRLAARDQKLLQARETRKTKRDPNAYSLNFSPVPRGRSLSPSTNAGPAHLPLISCGREDAIRLCGFRCASTPTPSEHPQAILPPVEYEPGDSLPLAPVTLICA